MSEPVITEPAEPTPAVECGDGLVRDPETGECVPIADANVVGAAGASGAEKGAVGLVDMVRHVVKELVPQLQQEFRIEARAMVDKEIAILKTEFGKSLRKELGLTADPTVTKSELDAAIRKSVLDLKIGGKRTPAGPLQKDASTDKQVNPGDIFKGYGGK